MADDNIFNNPINDNDKIPASEESKTSDASTTAEIPHDAAVSDAEPISTEAKKEEVEAQAATVQQPISSSGYYTPQNQPQQTQGTYYSYTPNPNTNYRGPYNSQSPYYQQGNYGQSYQQPPRKNRGLKITLSIIGIIAIVTVTCLVGFWAISGVVNIYENNKKPSYSSSEILENEGTDSHENLIINSKPNGSDEYSVNADGTMTAAAVIEKIRPSTVGIVQYVSGNNGIPTMNGQGSGIIISKDGYIITNAHVVNGASMITVVLDNDEEYRATIKGIDTQSDLAVLKIDATGLTAAELGDSSQTVVGESVIAIGNPGGLELSGSCTGGMVSGLNRTISSDTTGYAMTYIQTDAAINPGNSGGALVNMYGQVIGINSAKISAEGYEGLGFAIPINEALPIVNDLKQYGYVKNRAKIGIGFQLITEAVSQYYNNTIPAGLLITQIDEECDIATKGVHTQDIITKIDGKSITSTSAVYSLLQSKKPGDTVKLTVYRIGTRLSTSKTFEVDVILAEDKGQ